MEISSTYTGAIEEMPYFYLPAYANFCSGHGQKILFFMHNGASMTCKTWKNKFLVFLQPLYPPLDLSGNRLAEEKEKNFLEELILAAKKNNLADRISQSPAHAIFHAVPNQSQSAPFGTYYIDLRTDPEALYKNLHGKHRNVIRNAEKHGVQIKYGSDCLPDFFSLYRQTMDRSKMHCEPMSYFSGLCKSLEPNIICGVAYHNNIAQGAILIPYTRFGAFYLYGASAEKIEVTGAMNFLHWNTLQQLKEKKIKRYDFVGARTGANIPESLKGIQLFKERFGSQLEKGYLWKKDLAPAKCRIYDSMLSMKLMMRGQKLPQDLITQEIQSHESN